MRDRFDVTARLLRFYEVEGIVTPDRQGQQRLYPPGQVARFARAMQLRDMGVTVADIRRALAGEIDERTVLGATWHRLGHEIADKVHQRLALASALSTLDRAGAA